LKILFFLACVERDVGIDVDVGNYINAHDVPSCSKACFDDASCEAWNYSPLSNGCYYGRKGTNYIIGKFNCDFFGYKNCTV